jgi:hypothetical protein
MNTWPQLGHLPFRPRHFSSTRSGAEQAGQINAIIDMIFPRNETELDVGLKRRPLQALKQDVKIRIQPARAKQRPKL